MEPSTQATQVPANGATQDSVSQAPSGAEARINELTAKYRDIESRFTQSENDKAMLTATLAELAMKSSQPQAQTQPAVQVDPEEAARIRAVLGSELAELKQLMHGVRQEVATRLSPMELQFASQGGDPRVTDLAKKLYQGWSRDPSKKGWVPDDAITMATGMITRQDEASVRARAPQITQVLPGQNGTPQFQTQSLQAVPADIGSWPIDKQVEFWDKRTGDRQF